MCLKCYGEFEPERYKNFIESGRTLPAGNPPVDCCFCGQPTISGLYYRWDPEETICKGFHPGDQD